MLYNSFFITGGSGCAKTRLAAIDLAYINAGFNHNLMELSSILPKDCERLTEMPDIPFGQVVPSVVSLQAGVEGEVISAGIAYAQGFSKEYGKEFGIVAEAHGKLSEDEIKDELKKNIAEMLIFRDMSEDESDYITSSITVDDKHGAVAVALIYHNK